MDRQTKITTIARTLAFAALIGIAGQLALPVIAHARSAKCVAVPVAGQAGKYVVHCSTSRP